MAGPDVAFERLRCAEDACSVKLCRLPSPVPSGHRRPHRAGVCASPDWRGSGHVFGGNKARMSMKTKDSAKKSWAGADVVFERLRCAEGAVRSNRATCPDLSLRDIADPKQRGSAPASTFNEFGHLVRLEISRNTNCPYPGCMRVVRVF
jgi:hypothetical protein